MNFSGGYSLRTWCKIRRMLRATTPASPYTEGLAVAGGYIKGPCMNATRPLRTLVADYQIDPVNELVPLCPNCHAMIHRGNEAKPLSVEELRAMMRPSG